MNYLHVPLRSSDIKLSTNAVAKLGTPSAAEESISEYQYAGKKLTVCDLSGGKQTATWNVFVF